MRGVDPLPQEKLKYIGPGKFQLAELSPLFHVGTVKETVQRDTNNPEVHALLAILQDIVHGRIAATAPRPYVARGGLKDCGDRAARLRGM